MDRLAAAPIIQELRQIMLTQLCVTFSAQNLVQHGRHYRRELFFFGGCLERPSLPHACCIDRRDAE